MSEELGLVHIEPSRPLPSAIDELRYRAVRRIIDSQSEKAGRLLEQHQASFERITEALLDRGRLLKAELLALLTEDERSLL